VGGLVNQRHAGRLLLFQKQGVFVSLPRQQGVLPEAEQRSMKADSFTVIDEVLLKNAGEKIKKRLGNQ